jgi:hypothetical protein
MTGRREVVLGGLLTVIFGSSQATCQMAHAASGHSPGCMLPDDVGRALLDDVERALRARGGRQQLSASDTDQIIEKSGDPKFDYALARTLLRIGDAMQVRPGFAYYDDDVPNAKATKIRHLKKADGTVLFGRAMLRATRAEPDDPDIAVTAICAHEFGHILQYKLDLPRTVLAGQTTVKRLELHADFLAGFYAGMRKLEKRDYRAAVFATKMRSLGGYGVDNADHHGTPSERKDAIIKGFVTAFIERRALYDAVDIGVKYVSAL